MLQAECLIDNFECIDNAVKSLRPTLISTYFAWEIGIRRSSIEMCKHALKVCTVYISQKHRWCDSWLKA